MRFAPLARTFYEPPASVVAPLLTGHWLIRQTTEGVCGGVIVETEAYVLNDPACHGNRGLTPRNRAMWGPPGHAYVYFIYGLYFCFNAVCQPMGTAEAVLIRAIEPTFGRDLMQGRRLLPDPKHLTSGPSKLCLALDISRALDGADLCSVDSPIFIAENPGAADLRRELGPMITTKRVGITQAADLPLRFYLDKSPFVSKRATKEQRHSGGKRA